MNRYRIFIVIGVAALVAGRLVNPVVHAQEDEGDSIRVIGRLIRPVVIHAQDDEGGGIRDQIRIMTMILEASLGKDSIDRGLHLSVFDSRIRAEYIPTVGAIFTIPISFPLHPSGDDPGDAIDEAAEEDLWDRFSSASERTPRSAEPVLVTVAPVEPGKLHISISKELANGQVAHDRAVVARGTAKAATFDLQGRFMTIQDGTNWDFVIGNSKFYDPVKVSTLTHRIVETIAQYGHRLKSLPNSERVLVVLEAPERRASRGGFQGGERIIFSKPLLADRAREIVEEKKIVIERTLKERRERSERDPWHETINLLRRPSTLWLPVLSRPIARDHRLLAFKKSDLQEERSYDSIKGKVETTDY